MRGTPYFGIVPGLAWVWVELHFISATFQWIPRECRQPHDLDMHFAYTLRSVKAVRQLLFPPLASHLEHQTCRGLHPLMRCDLAVATPNSLCDVIEFGELACTGRKC